LQALVAHQHPERKKFTSRKDSVLQYAAKSAHLQPLSAASIAAAQLMKSWIHLM
jgi:hypothetical protein